MSIGAQTALALLRALLIALFAVGFSGALSRWLTAQRGRSRLATWLLLLAPYFTPALIISYAYSKVALILLVWPFWHDALYVAVLALKLTPLAVVIRTLLPSPLGTEGRHTFDLLALPAVTRRFVFHLRGAGAGPWIAGALVFLFAFADFELASLWSIHTWTMAVFDAQIGGLALPETLRLAMGPLTIQLVVLAGVITRSGNRAEPSAESPVSRSRWPWGYLVITTTGVSLAPLGLILFQSTTGWATLATNFVLTREIGASVIFALVAACCAEAIVQWAGPATFRKTGLARTSLLVVALPGLLGALVVSLLLLALFQLPLLHAGYDTPLPLALALTIILLPTALLIHALFPSTSPALHLARQNGSGRLLWPMSIRPRFIGWSVLFCAAYFDFTAASILAPIGFTPVFVRLHNLAHYGQTAVLSAMLIAAFGVPLLVVGLVGLILRMIVCRRVGSPALQD